MPHGLSALLISAGSVGLLHTLLGPDHYLPFIAMAKSGDWSLRKTTRVTVLCGLAHALSSILLGAIGIAFGLALTKVEAVEASRGGLAAWLLIVFGAVYLAYGLKRSARSTEHSHRHFHANGTVHEHKHNHAAAHLHVHPQSDRSVLSTWALFLIFAFGPCEALIPFLMYPAATGSWLSLALVTLVFALATIGTMLSVVLLGVSGLRAIPGARFARYTHALAGASILLCGLAIRFLGL